MTSSTNKFKELLEERGITAYALSAITGINKNSLSLLSLGKSKFENITFKNAVKMSQALGVSLEYLADYFEIEEHDINVSYDYSDVLAELKEGISMNELSLEDKIFAIRGTKVIMGNYRPIVGFCFDSDDVIDLKRDNNFEYHSLEVMVIADILKELKEWNSMI